MDTSILRTTKKMLGIPDADTSFDLDIVTHINGAFSTISDLGVGPPGGFVIDDTGEEQWDDIDPALTPNQVSQVKTLVFLQVRLAFDPPATSFAITALEKQIEQIAWRLNVRREETEWVDPDSEVTV